MTAHSVSARLRAAMSRHGVNCVQLATAANVKTSFLYDILNGKSTNPSAVQLAKVASTLNVSMSYLVGTDKPYTEYASASPCDNYITVGYLSLDKHNGKIISQVQSAPILQLRNGWLEESLGLSANDVKFFFVTDDTMSPAVLRGDSVLIDTTDTNPTSSGIFLIFDGNKLTLRNIEFVTSTKHTSIGTCSEPPPLYKSGTDLEDTLYIGRAVWLSRCF